jgi:hypothetical protein
MYWQQPRLRQCIILAQRLLPPLTAAASVGYIPARFFELASLRYWPMVGQYVYLGWTAFMLVVSAIVRLAGAGVEVATFSCNALPDVDMHAHRDCCSRF